MRTYGAIPFSRFDPFLLLIDGDPARELFGQYLKEVRQMQNEKYLELDALAAPNGYVVPPTKEDLAYVVHFRKTCQRYQIDFAKADSDERDFVIHMAEKTFLQKRA